MNSIYERDGEWELSFGTAGIRACLGSGAAEINPATMGRFVNGVAAWLLSTYGAEACAGRGVVIGYDARFFSTDFAALGAALLTARSISVRIFPEYTPTPLIAYAVRPLGALLGLCFTASHNPAEYNGCKLYGEDLCRPAKKSLPPWPSISPPPHILALRARPITMIRRPSAAC